MLELAVGAALGPGEDEKGGRGKKALSTDKGLDSPTLRNHFRRLYAHHELVEECLAGGYHLPNVL